jgi:branched-chain amino acid transport system substrate-binding protein
MAGPIELTPTDHAGQKSAIYLKFDGTNMTAVPGAYRSLWTYQPK